MLPPLAWPTVAVADTSVAESISAYAQTDHWSQVHRLKFTWVHHSKNLKRNYDWRVKEGRATLREGGAQVEFNVAGTGLDTPAKKTAHKKFINDSYWLLFEFHLGWDDVTLENLGPVVPTGNPGGGPLNGLKVSYPAAGGYTPGDTYTLFSVPSGDVVAWEYTPAGSTTGPKFHVSRGGDQTVGPIRVPTRFKNKDGHSVISIVGLSIE